MFKINFRITYDQNDLIDLTDEDIDEGLIEGYFEITINEKKYGYYSEDIQVLSVLSIWLIMWFESLIELLITFEKGHNYFAINDIEFHNTWLEFKRIDCNHVEISELEAAKNEGVTGFVTEPPRNGQYSNLKNEIVSYDEMRLEILQKVDRYLVAAAAFDKRFSKSRALIDLKNRAAYIKNMY